VPTYRLTIEYEGTRFSGWQVQPRGRTAQGVLLDALREATGQGRLDLQGAGRTDAGVHALAQVASLRCPQPIRPREVAARLDALLPADLAVRSIVPAPPAFHARHDAVGRAYRYQLSRRRSAFGKRWTWWVVDALDITAMRDAATGFVGRHDFAAFGKRGGGKDSTIVVLAEAAVFDFDEVVVVRFVASHFVWNQVRRMVGALVGVGRGDAAPADVAAWLDGSRRPPPLGAPAAGLFLEAVRYPGEPFALPPPLPIGVPVRAAHGRGSMGDRAGGPLDGV
jgi:tRNA pseudouridine38-40 synthase